MTTTTYTQALDLIKQLPPRERVQLAAEVLATLASTDDAWDELDTLAAESANYPPLPKDSAELLAEMRR